MILSYLLLGSLVYASYDVAPAETLRDIQPGSRVRRRDVLLAVTVWCVGLAVWPLAIVLRAVENVRRWRFERTNRDDEHAPKIPAPRPPSEPFSANPR